MEIKPTSIPGCYQIFPIVREDARGKFVKVFHREIFQQKNLNIDFAEEYYSVSQRNVLRGLHFQLPPEDHVKMVYCVAGEVLDAVVDLRLNSPTYGQWELFQLSAKKANVLYLPSGLAHGFYVKSQQAIMVYKVSTVYVPERDTGILWNSAGIPWECENPIVSERDRKFLPFSQFKSPFLFQNP
ncbi:dTDP-4-dehydrorhamnose 3,5-epimerase [Lusitaniella coriacea]|uniref:dTDP-4-dehydrorhamnose 3,5-epimerase n=1 Tax=Lusitaniella coriacea TaxID=1983105 RepID=UPI003CE7C416